MYVIAYGHDVPGHINSKEPSCRIFYYRYVRYCPFRMNFHYALLPTSPRLEVYTSVCCRKAEESSAANLPDIVNETTGHNVSFIAARLLNTFRNR